MDRVNNEEVRSTAGIERKLASRADQRVLRWFGHVERIDECLCQKGVYCGVSEGRVRGRPRLGWMDGWFPWTTEELRWRLHSFLMKMETNGDM